MTLPQSARYVLDPCSSLKRCLSLNGAPGTQKYHKTCCPLCAGIGVVPADHTPNPEWESALRYMRRSFTTREKKRIEHEPGLTRMQAIAKVWEKRRERALDRLRRGTTESRTQIKARIWERDGGRCQICNLDLDRYPQLATLGHRVDRSCGGSDSDVNLEIECVQCNRHVKPFHETLEAYFVWRAEYRGETIIDHATVEDTPEPRSEPEGWLGRLRRVAKLGRAAA